jgi:hypothetical protein
MNPIAKNWSVADWNEQSISAGIGPPNNFDLFITLFFMGRLKRGIGVEMASLWKKPYVLFKQRPFIHVRHCRNR